MVHWDRQSPGVRHDRADRLVDLYASGEQRSYGPLFLQRKMNISNQAFSEGDFSLSISDLQVCVYLYMLHSDDQNMLLTKKVRTFLEDLVLRFTLEFG